MITAFTTFLFFSVHVFPSSANLFSTSKFKNYVQYDDQQYAENKYLEMGPMHTMRKILYKEVPVNDSTVCNMTAPNVIKICDEIATYRRSRNSFKDPYRTQEKEQPNECMEYNLKLTWDYRLEKKNETVVARKCPTKPALYISDGRNTGAVFVYASNKGSKKNLKLIDYITFKQRTNYEAVV